MLKAGRVIFLVAFFAYLVQALFFFIDKPDELLAVPLVLILGGAGVYWLSKETDPEDADFQVNIFLIAYSVRILMGMVFYGWDLTEVFGDEDASGYVMGWAMAENWYRNGLDGFISDLEKVFFDQMNVGQALIWGIAMFVAGGPSRLIVSAINSFAGAMLVIVIYRMAHRIFDRHTARMSAVLATFWASIVLFSVGTAKEILVIFFEWTLLYLAVRNADGIRPKDGLAAIPAFLALSITRFYALYLVAAAWVFRIFTSGAANVVRNAVLATIVVGSVMAFLGAGGVITRDLERLERQNTRIDAWRQNVARHTGSGVEIYSEYENQNIAIPIAAVYFFFAPFPWEAFSGSLRSTFGALENMAIIAILIIGFPAWRIFFFDKFFRLAPVFVFCALYAGLHIWGLSNVGLAWRHKQTIMPLLFMLVAVGITQRKLGWRILRSKFQARDERITIVPGRIPRRS